MLGLIGVVAYVTGFLNGTVLGPPRPRDHVVQRVIADIL